MAKRSWRVLIVDDEQLNRDIFLRLLRILDCSVDAAGDGPEALRLLELQSYDMVLMDCRMPEMDGFEVTQKIRELETRLGRQRTPVVAVTGHALEGQAALADMDDFLRKPVRLAEIDGVLQKWCARLEWA